MFRGIIFIQWFIGVSKNCIMPLFYHFVSRAGLFSNIHFYQTKHLLSKLPSCIVDVENENDNVIN